MSGSVSLQPIPLYLQYSANESQYANAALTANPQDDSLLTYFKANAANITTPAQLLGNYKILNVVLTAFNLQGSINNTAVLRQLMTQDPTSSTSLAKQLNNAQYTAFATAFSDWTTSPFASATNVAQIAQSYTTNTFETTADSTAPGLANALYFARMAPKASTISQVQSDPTLLKVAVATTGITYDQYVQLPFAQQTTLLTNSLKVSQLTTPSYVNHVAEQYLIQNSSSGVSAPPPGSIGSLYSDDTTNDGDSLLNILDPGANLSDDSSSGGVLSLFA